MAKKKKFYTVWQGHVPGVYANWADCLAQTKNFPNAKYKSYPTKQQAEAAFHESFSNHIGTGSKSSKKTKTFNSQANIIKDSISVDAACSGNPGVMEYQGVDTVSKSPIFYQGPYQDGTNNVGEFLALVHALALLKKVGKDTPIYTDSKTAMAWVRNKKVKTTLEKNNRNAILFDLMERAIQWLHNNSYNNPILKWDTKNWGEIPADFGRK